MKQPYAEFEEAALSIAAQQTSANAKLAAEHLENLEKQIENRIRLLRAQNAALAIAKDEADRAAAAKTSLLAAASHDLRQPLHAMTLFATALSRRVEGREARELTSQLMRSLVSLKEMFDALLNVSRLDVGLIKPNVVRLPVSDIIGRVASGFAAEAENRGLRFSWRSVDAVVVSDPAILEAMVRNLVSNAMKFTKTGGVLLAARKRRSRVAIEVYDTGPGVKLDEHRRIFREFVRSKEQATGPNEGLGLGLSLVNRYSRLLGVTIEVRSRPGRGSRFTLFLPNVAQKPAAASLQSPLEKTSLSGKSILVLDDEPSVVLGLTSDLKDRGNDAHGFHSPAAAEAAIRGGLKVDLAVVDFDMAAEETGPQFVARMERHLGQKIPALIVSGATDPEARAEIVASGRPWLTKPADPDAIANILSNLAA